MSSAVVVVGSANRDIVFTVSRIPQPGETLIAESADRYPGGKGLNQAVASARAGVSTTFVAALGDDDDGRVLSAVLADASISGDLVREALLPTGQAFIVVDGSGENTIVVASGANATLTSLTVADETAIVAANVLLMQLELPLSIVIDAAVLAHQNGTKVILNAAPAQLLPPELLTNLDYLIVNEHEACLVGGSEELQVASGKLAAQVDRVVVTLGSRGCILFENGVEFARADAHRVTAVDTTGAGDTWCGAFAAALAEGQPFTHAAGFASAAAALSVQALGAVPSVPHRDAIDAQLESVGALPVDILSDGTRK